MANYSSSLFSATTSSWTDRATPIPVLSEQLLNNPLRASQVIATSPISARAITLPLEDMQIKFTLLAAEVDRLLILNSLMTKECEQWRKRFLETERPSYNKDSPDADNSKYKISDLEKRLEMFTRQCQQLEESVASKDREINTLRANTFGLNTVEKDREISYWKDKCTQIENELSRRALDVKAETEALSRERVEREIKSAVQFHDEEKRTLHLRIDGLIRERDVLLRQPIGTLASSQTDLQNRYNKSAADLEQRNRDVAFWKEKYQNLEAQIEPNIRSAMESRINETIGPIVQEKNYFEEQFNLSQQKLADNEERIAVLTAEYNRVNDQLRASNNGFSNSEFTAHGIVKSSNVEREKRAVLSAGSDQSNKMSSEQIRNLEAQINTLENEKRSLRGALSEYEGKFANLISDNTVLADQMRAAIDLDMRFQNLLQAYQSLEGTNRELQEEIYQLQNNASGNKYVQGEQYALQKRVEEVQVDIQRLNGEVETWRTKYFNSEKQHNEELARLRQDIEKNTRSRAELEYRDQIEGYEKERIGYESTLDILRQKFTDFEEKMVPIIDENEKLKNHINELETEQGFLKTDQRHFESHKDRDAQDLKKQIILLDEKFRSEKNKDTQKIRQLEQQLNTGTGDSEVWRQKYYELEQETQDYIEKTLAEVEVHFRERIQNEKDEYAQELLQQKLILEERLTDAERIIEEDNRKSIDLKRRYEQDQKAYIEAELQGLQKDLNRKISEYEAENHRLNEVIQDHRMKQVLYFIEIERLFLINGEFIEEINRITEEINYLLVENERLNQELTNLNQNERGSAQDKAKYERLIKDLKDQIEEYEDRTQVIMLENSRLGDLSLSRLKEIDNLKNSLVVRGGSPTENNKKSQLEAFKKSSVDLNERHEDEKHALEEQIMQLKQSLEANKHEMKKLQAVNERRKAENDALYQEIERTRDSVKRDQQPLEAELKIQAEQYQQSLKEIDEMRRARDFYRIQLEQLMAKMKENVDLRISETIGSGQGNYRTSYASDSNRDGYR